MLSGLQQKGLIDLLGVHAVKSVPFMVAARGRPVTYRRRCFLNRGIVTEQIGAYRMKVEGCVYEQRLWVEFAMCQSDLGGGSARFP